MPRRLSIQHHLRESALFNQRALIAAFLVALFVLILLFRLAYLQLMEHGFYSTLSKKNIMTIVPMEPNRGLVFDRYGVLLAKNVPSYNLVLIPGQIKHLNKTIEAIQKVIPLSANDLKLFHRELYQHRPYEPVTLKANLTESELSQFYVNQYHFAGVNILPKMLRYYPLGKTTAHVLGYVGRINPRELGKLSSSNYSASDYIGKIGVEKYYETTLHGQVGFEEAEIDANGHIVRIQHKTPPKPGGDLTLTIDSRLQQLAINALGDDNGAIVALDPRNGEILALVSQPSFNPNGFVSGMSQKEYLALLNSPDHPLYNRAIRGQFAPGSTVKPFYALMGLSNGLISSNTRLYDTGKFQLPHSSHVYHDWRAHGWVDVVRAITVSCDFFFYNLAMNSGIQRMDDLLHGFGFGEHTGIDMPSELTGLVPDPLWKRSAQGQSWFPGDTVIMGIGQGSLLATPLQLAEATAALSMRGVRFKPHLVKTYTDSQGVAHASSIEELPPIDFPEQAWKTTIHGMQQVTESPEGTAHYAFLPSHSYSVAAKTGTAELFGKGGKREQHNKTPKKLRNNHLFIAFAPVDKPELALAIVIEHAPKADKVARMLFDYYFQDIAKKQNGKLLGDLHTDRRAVRDANVSAIPAADTESP